MLRSFGIKLTMVTRNFSLQDLPFSRLLSVPEDEKEFLTLEELKPHHLTELNNQSQINTQEHQYLSDQQLQIAQDGIDQNYNVYYDLNTQQKTKYGIILPYMKFTFLIIILLCKNLSQWTVLK